jgi:4'-phosphopantetheinyl transferase
MLKGQPLSLSFDLCLEGRQPLAFRMEAAGATDAKAQHQHDDDIEVHFAFTAGFPALLQDDDILDEEDWADISRQRNRELRRRAIASRVLLRKSLSDIFSNHVPASQWRFVRTGFGKLILAANGQPQVHFSISHTRGASAIVISKFAPVGIDVEAFDCRVDNDALETGLSRREQTMVSRLDPGSRSQALLKLWTLKEAYTKLVGIGLSAHLPSYEFLADPLRPGRYRGTEEHVRDARLETWFMDNPHGKYCISIAVGAASFDRVSDGS